MIQEKILTAASEGAGEPGEEWDHEGLYLHPCADLGPARCQRFYGQYTDLGWSLALRRFADDSPATFG